MLLRSIVAIAAVLSAASCNTKKCKLASTDDVTSLMQFQKSLMPGQERQDDTENTDARDGMDETELAAALSRIEAAQVPKHAQAESTEESPEPNEEEQDVKEAPKSPEELAGFETFALEGEAGAMPADFAGCEDMGCQGSGPNCGGNTFDCTSNGWMVAGWFKSCSHVETCATGWKVRCAQCPKDSKAKSVAMPAPSAGPSLWVAPAPGPTPKPAPTPAPASAPVMPTNAPMYIWNGSYNVSEARHTLSNETAELTLFKKALQNATMIEAAVEKNITHFEHLEHKAKETFKKNRAAAVTYAKKVQLANITYFKARKAMSSAYYAEKSAAHGAQDAQQKSENARAEARYYEKQLIDKVQEVHDSEAAVHVGRIAVSKAMSDLAEAKRAAERHLHRERSHDKHAKMYANEGTHYAMDLAVESTMEEAYAEASGPDRNKSNVPEFEWFDAMD